MERRNRLQNKIKSFFRHKIGLELTNVTCQTVSETDERVTDVSTSSNLVLLSLKSNPGITLCKKQL